jgi:exosortase C (VPDSG-CTERM-specific)
MRTNDPEEATVTAAAPPPRGGSPTVEIPPAVSPLRRNGAIAFGAVLLIAFGRNLYDLAIYVAGTDLHSHVLLVPVVTAYLLWINRARWPRTYSTDLAGGIVSSAIGGLALMAAYLPPSPWGGYSRNDFLAIVALSFVCFVAAGGFFFLGRRWMSAAAFPVGFLIFLTPLPDAAVHALETASKYASAEAAYLLFEVTGTPIMRDGLFFKIPGITLEVAQECSGIRSSWVLFITSLVASYLFLDSPWRRTALVALVFPLAILRNGFRILVIGLLCVHIGPEMIHSIIHKRGGPLFFALSLIPLFAVMWWLRRGEQSSREKAQKTQKVTEV